MSHDHKTDMLLEAGEHVERLLRAAIETAPCEHVAGAALALALGHLCEATGMPLPEILALVARAHHHSGQIRREALAAGDDPGAPAVYIGKRPGPNRGDN